jgi:hypothetical protein
METRKESVEDAALGRRSLVSAPWVNIDHDTEPVLISAVEKADRVVGGDGKFTYEELQRVVAHLLRGSI